MKINLNKELKERTLVSNIIFGNMSMAIVEQLIEEGKTEDGVIGDVRLTVNGREIDLQAFIESWQSQVSESIVSKAKELFDEKFGEIDDLFCDLGDRIKSEIHKRLEEWEKEDWEKENLI